MHKTSRITLEIHNTYILHCGRCWNWTLISFMNSYLQHPWLVLVLFNVVQVPRSKSRRFFINKHWYWFWCCYWEIWLDCTPCRYERRASGTKWIWIWLMNWKSIVSPYIFIFIDKWLRSAEMWRCNVTQHEEPLLYCWFALPPEVGYCQMRCYVFCLLAYCLDDTLGPPF